MIALWTLLSLLSGTTLEVGLQDAIRVAGDSALAPSLARSRAQESGARRDELAARLWPRLDLSASQVGRTYNALTSGLPFRGDPKIPWYSLQDLRAQVSMPLVNFEALDRRREASRTEEMRREEAAVSRDAARLQGGTAWIELARCDALVALRAEGLEIARDLLRMTEDQRASGAATGLDLVRARSQEVQAERALLGARIAREKASSTLVRLLGRPAVDSIVPRPALPLTASTEAPVPAREPVASIRAADAAVVAAREARAHLRHEFFPTLSVAADWGLSGTHLQDDGEWTGSVGAFTQWNLWDGGARAARRVQARERERQAALVLDETRRTTDHEQDLARREWTDSRTMLALSMESSALADSELALSREKFRAGASGNLEVVQAMASRTQAKVALVEAAATHQTALLRLKAALGDWDGIR